MDTRHHRARHRLPWTAGEPGESGAHQLQTREESPTLEALAHVALDSTALIGPHLAVEVLGHVMVRPTVITGEAQACQGSLMLPNPTRALFQMSAGCPGPVVGRSHARPGILVETRIPKNRSRASGQKRGLGVLSQTFKPALVTPLLPPRRIVDGRWSAVPAGASAPSTNRFRAVRVSGVPERNSHRR